MKKTIFFIGLVAVLMFVILPDMFAGGKAETKPTKIIIRAGHVNPPGEPAYEAWEVFKKKMHEKLGNTVEVQTFPQGQLGNERELIEQVKIGSLEMTAPAVSPLALQNSELNVLNLPYIFKNEGELWKVVDGPIGKRLIESTRQKAGVLILNWWSTGVRHIFSKRPIRRVADMRDMKIRVMENPVFIDAFRALNALPTPMPYGEVYQALATGLVDAAENDSSGYRNMKFFEVAPVYSLTAHLIITKPVLIHPAFYDKLPADVKKTLDETLQEATNFQRNLFATNFEEDIKWLKQQKVTVVDDVNLAEFQKIMVTVWAKYEANIGKELLNEVKRFLGIQ